MELIYWLCTPARVYHLFMSNIRAQYRGLAPQRGFNKQDSHCEVFIHISEITAALLSFLLISLWRVKAAFERPQAHLDEKPHGVKRWYDRQEEGIFLICVYVCMCVWVCERARLNVWCVGRRRWQLERRARVPLRVCLHACTSVVGRVKPSGIHLGVDDEARFHVAALTLLPVHPWNW